MILDNIIEDYISGDWGNEEYSSDSPNAVFCIRAADFAPILSVDYTNIPTRYINDSSFENKLLKAGDIVIEKSGGSPTQSTGRVILITEDLIREKRYIVCSNFCEAFRVKKEWNPFYVFSYMQFLYNEGVFFNFEGKTSGLKNLQMDQAFSSIDIPEQKSDISILASIDEKIALTRKINIELEALVREIYDYWFVQFDFPNKDGKPYKSSGGNMVWDERIKKAIPEGWEVSTLSSKIIDKKSGDWGQDEFKAPYTMKVNCIRGADFADPSNAPIRYINNKNDNRLLAENDIIVEISGGSPIQATGRSVFVSKGLLERYKGHIICSNFCQALTLENVNTSLYFFYTWVMLYDNDNMFNYEGKTSGIKNLQIDILLENYCYFPSNDLLSIYAKIVQESIVQKDLNVAELNDLVQLRSFLLPLLMNGQVYKAK